MQENMTCVRLIVDLVMAHDVLSETQDYGLVHVGVAVASAEAFAAGAVPDPETSADYPREGWLYLASAPVGQALPAGGQGVWRYDAKFKADIRAARKVDRGVLYMILNLVNITNIPSAVVAGRVRSLFLL